MWQLRVSLDLITEFRLARRDKRRNGAWLTALNTKFVKMVCSFAIKETRKKPLLILLDQNQRRHINAISPKATFSFADLYDAKNSTNFWATVLGVSSVLFIQSVQCLRQMIVFWMRRKIFFLCKNLVKNDCPGGLIKPVRKWHLLRKSESS